MTVFTGNADENIQPIKVLWGQLLGRHIAPDLTGIQYLKKPNKTQEQTNKNTLSQLTRKLPAYIRGYCCGALMRSLGELGF